MSVKPLDVKAILDQKPDKGGYTGYQRIAINEYIIQEGLDKDIGDDELITYINKKAKEQEKEQQRIRNALAAQEGGAEETVEERRASMTVGSGSTSGTSSSSSQAARR